MPRTKATTVILTRINPFCRILSNFNACLSIVLSVYCLFIEEGMRYEDVWHDSKAARLACALIVGYMLAGK